MLLSYKCELVIYEMELNEPFDPIKIPEGHVIRDYTFTNSLRFYVDIFP